MRNLNLLSGSISHSPVMTPLTQFVIFSDLDGTLLDGTTYSFEAATEALQALHSRRVPVVLVTSKTRAEIEPLRFRLQLDHPFVVENGGGIVIPKGYFPFPIDHAVLRGAYQVVELGVPYAQLRATIKELQQSFGRAVRGLGDLTTDEIAQHTGLSQSEAHLAKQREYDEPFLVPEPADVAERVRLEIEKRGFQCVAGGRFYHLMGAHDKGQAVRLLMDWYRRHYGNDHRELVAVAVGDSPNDLPMLAVVDRPFLVQRPDGSFDDRVHLPRLNHVPAPGPTGWNRLVLDLLQNTADSHG